MTDNAEELELEKEFKARNKDELKIIDALNSLNEKVLNNYYPELKICREHELSIYELFESHFNSIETSENEKEDNFESKIAIAVFRVLFKGKSGFNKNDLDKKICSFNLVLKLLYRHKLDDNDNKAIEEMRKYELFEEIAKEYNCDYYYSYCLYIILEYSESKIFFIDIFISFMKNSYREEGDNLEIVKGESISEDKLINMNSIDLVKSLRDIYNKGDTFYVLELEQGQNLIKQKKLSLEEIAKIINKNNKQGNKKKKNKKNKKKAKENTNIETNNNQEGNDIQNERYEQRKVQKKNNIQDKSKEKAETHEKKESIKQKESKKNDENKEQKESKKNDENKEQKKESKKNDENKEQKESKKNDENKEQKESKKNDENKEQKESKKNDENKEQKESKKNYENKEQKESKEEKENKEQKEKEMQEINKGQKESNDPNQLLLSLVKDMKIKINELSATISEYKKELANIRKRMTNYQEQLANYQEQLANIRKRMINYQYK